MGFWDDVAEYGLGAVGAVGGGVAGFYAGGPMGAVAGAGLGASLGGKAGQLIAGNDDNIEATQKERENLWNNMAYVGPPPGQGLTAADRAAFRTAEQRAGQFASGREGALLQGDRMRGGGAAASGKLLSAQLQSSQAATERVSNSNLYIAGQAADRDRENRMMLQDFNMKNTMMKDRGLQGRQDLQERQQARKSKELSGLYSDLGAVGMYGLQGMNGPKMPSAGGAPSVPLQALPFPGVTTSIPNPNRYDAMMGDFFPPNRNRMYS